MKRLAGARVTIVLGVALMQGCATVGYYSQSIGGHLRLMAKREPIEQLLEDPTTPPRLRLRLEEMVRVRNFASADVALPENGSYRSYADLERPFAVWTVVAAPELAFTPKQWCFPVVGCVSYRGYYDEAEAAAFADRLRREGLDVTVNGVKAYSTLGWFDDPVTNTILDQPRPYAARIIFHELAHQRLYVKDDSAFNEAFAVAVERAGVRRWLRTGGSRDKLTKFELQQQRQREFLDLVFAARKRLELLYESDRAAPDKRERKAVLFDELREDYAALRTRWGGYPGYDRWFAEDLNNAKLASVATYYDLVPAFERLLARHDGDLNAFYRACEGLAELPKDKRGDALQSLAKEGGNGRGEGISVAR